MLRKISISLIGILCLVKARAQDSTAAAPGPKPTITGSVDAYYRFNFANAKDVKQTNNLTSFTNSQNSFELGMASVKISHTVGKVGGVLDLGFGQRAKEFSYNETGIAQSVKQAYLTWAPSSKITFTMGKFATHVGYELLDPQLNRNYSMDYMFSYGPFSHTGLKADFALSPTTGLMAGIANPTDMLSASFANKFFIGQFHAATKNGRLTGYLNYVGGEDTSKKAQSQFDLVLTGKVSSKFSIGYNGTVKTVKNKADGAGANSWWGSALYLNLDPTSKFGITLRGEYFDDKKGVAGLSASFFDATLSLNIKEGNLIIIPELRLDNANANYFYKNSGALAKSTGSFILAAVYSF